MNDRTVKSGFAKANAVIRLQQGGDVVEEIVGHPSGGLLTTTD